jgi:predicted AlkP superfamily phosphohydrolase/phosphomutase
LLYLNLIDREENGVVSPNDRRSLAAEISSKLRQIQDPLSGEPLFENVYTPGDLYSGPAVDRAPDLILDAYSSGWNIRTSQYTSGSGPVIQRYFVQADKRHDFGWHSRDGIFVFSGAGFAQKSAEFEGCLEDIPATLLHLHNVPVPEDYDGRVLEEVLAPQIRGRTVRYQPAAETDFREEESYTPDEREALMGHLRALGYLD